MPPENPLIIYADGSSFSTPRRGGMALRVVTLDAAGYEVVEDVVLPGHQAGTNNEMELLAAIRAIELARDHPLLDQFDRIFVKTDSRYVVDNVPRAMFQWSKSRWRNRDGRPVDNSQLWKQLVSLLQKLRRRVEFKWVKAHASDKHNKAVDKLAKQSAKGHLKVPLKVAAVRRKITSRSVERGSIAMRGQTLQVRIITDTYLKPQRAYKYKYEVIAGDESVGNVDLIYSTECLRAGHHYEILVNADAAFPQIVQVLRELERT